MNWGEYVAALGRYGFVPVELADSRLMVREGYERHAAAIGLADARSAVETVSGGRAAHPVVSLPGGGRIVVRRYRRGGAVRNVNRETYFIGHRAFAEALATERARGGGVRVPRVVAALERPSHPGYHAALASVWIPDSLDLASWLNRANDASAAGDGEADRVLRSVGEQIRRMHDAGIAHPDVNLRNLLVARGSNGGPAVWVLDFDRARLYEGGVPAARRERDLRRLVRSAGKLGAPIGAVGWSAMGAGYGADWPLGADPLG